LTDPAEIHGAQWTARREREGRWENFSVVIR
jgi:hypothetical protein